MKTTSKTTLTGGRSFLYGISLCGILSVLPNSAQAFELITNGNFETPGVAAWSLFSSIPGWTATADRIEIGQGASVYGIGGSSGQVLELDANHNATVEQSLSLGAGIYGLTFDAARRVNGMSGRPLDTADFDVLWNGSVVASIHPASTTMTHYGLNLTGIGGTNTLAFRGMGTDDSYGALIDNVSMQAVPEPGTWALGASAGLLGISLLRRRKRR